MLLLGIETSCDETAAAVVKDGRGVLSSVLYSQEKIHGKFGGVVPELACRHHTAVIMEVVGAALSRAGVGIKDLSGVAVTQGPGLIGALLVGISYGKALAYSQNFPLIGVNHLDGHIAAVHLENRDLEFPVVALVVSGGHTNLYYLPADGSMKLLGQTVDDAAGEAFDKGAKMLGLPYPGGPAIDEMSKTGDPARVNFPRPSIRNESLNMSFSGLKTSLRYYLERVGFPKAHGDEVPHLAAAFQQAIVDVLIEKTMSAAEQYHVKTVFVTGGVAANTVLRRQMGEACGGRGLKLVIPTPHYCTDNGAMIAAAGYLQFDRRPRVPLEMSPWTGLEPRS